MQIKVGKVPGRTQVLELQGGATIAEALRVAGLSVTGHELRYNGNSTEDFNKEIEDGAIILLTPRIKGNADTEYIEVNFKGEEYVLKRTDSVADLLEAAGWDENDIESDETVAIRKEDKWIAVDLHGKVVKWGSYDIVDAEDAEYPEESIRVESTCNCGGNCSDREVSRLIVGDLEIIVRKIR